MKLAAAKADVGTDRSRTGTENSSTAVRLAIVGAGYWGPNLIRCASALRQADLTMVCDLQPERLAEIQAKHPGVTTTQDFEQVLANPDVDAVVLATPISTHHRLTRACLMAGKHVLVEKPLATCETDAVELVELAKRNELVLLPGHTFLYSPPVNVVRDLIQSGEIGELYAVSMSRVNLGIHQSDSSVLWDLAPHDFSILRYWLDELPTEMNVIGRDCIVPGVPDVAFISMRFGSSIIANVELAWLAPSKLRRTTIIGSKKMISYDDTSNEPVRVFDTGVEQQTPKDYGEFQLSYRVGDILSPRVTPAEPLALELADFCDAIRTGASVRSRPEIGLDVVRMVAMAEECLTPSDADEKVVAGQRRGAVNGSRAVDLNARSQAEPASTRSTHGIR